MRTLKKTLCLVLVLAMMVGLCAISASAITFDDYSDKDAIQHPEAVKVLTALKVLQGDDKGTFRPTESMTRAEGATFFTKLCAASGAGTSSFTDMGNHAWAQPYVAYCEQNGIIAGYGDGTFGPSNPVTYVQWAKMCICALGYDPAAEGILNNPAWEVSVIKLVNKLNLATGVLNIDWNAPITRDDAAQFAYNTLQATMVEYDGALTVTTSDGTKVEVGANAKAVANNAYDYKNRPLGDGKGTMQFCENYFPNLKMKTKVDDETFGFTNNVWFMGDNRVDHNLTPAKKIAAEQASSTMATYNTGIAGVSGKTLYTDGKASKETPIAVKVNGQPAGNVYANRLDTVPRLGAYKGADAFLIDTSEEDSEGFGVADTLLIKQPLLAQVTKVTEATASKDRFVTLKVYLDDGAGKTKPVTIDYTTDSFARYDYILVYPTDLANPTSTNILEAKLADTAAGTLSKVTKSATDATATGSLTVGGVAYNVGSKANLGPEGATVAKGIYALGTGMTAYLSNGFVLGVVADSVAYSNYVFVLGNNPNGSALGNNSWTIGSVDQTAATSEVIGAGITTQPQADALKNVWATKTEAGSAYTFKAANKSWEITGLPAGGITSGNATLGFAVGHSGEDAYKVIADSKTVFVVRTSKGFASYTGLANVPNYKVVTSAYALMPDYAGAHAAAVYLTVDTTGGVNGASSASIYMFTGAATGTELDGKTTVFDYVIIDNGEVKTAWATSGTGFPAGVVEPTYAGSYLQAVDKLDGAAGVPLNQAYVATSDVIAVTNEDLTVKTGGATHVFVLADDAVAYYYNGITLKTGKPVDIIDGLSKGTISLIQVSDKDTRIKTVYFMQNDGVTA